MYDYFLTFRSVTAAMQGSRSLKEAGIANTMLRTPQKLRQQGCGYSLKVDGYPAAIERLRQDDIPFQKLYRRLPDGQWQEVAV